MEINKLEEEIVKKFVVKNKQERILWELGSSKKREQVFWRFAGTAIFRPECLHFLNYMAPNELEKYLSKFVHTKNVYYLGEDYIGEITLKESLEKINMGAICIIYCGNGIGYYQGEEDQGHRPRCLLRAVAAEK